MRAVDKKPPARACLWMGHAYVGRWAFASAVRRACGRDRGHGRGQPVAGRGPCAPGTAPRSTEQPRPDP